MTLTVLFLFFRNFIWITTSITVFECYLLAVSGDVRVVLTLLWTKLAANAVIGLLFLMLQGNRMFFFHNLGYSRFQLFGSALLFDLAIWTSLVTTTALIS